MRKWMTDKLFLYHWVRISILLFIYDIIVMNVSYGLALWLRFDFRFSDIPYDYLTTWVKYIPIHTACTLILMFAFKLYRSMWRFASFDELSRTSIVCAISMALHIVGTTVVFQRMPISYYVMGGILQYILITGIRFSYRIFRMLKIRTTAASVSREIKNTMIIGAGEAGRAIISEFNKSGDKMHTKICCIIDDNKNKKNRYIDGIPIVGTREDIPQMVKKYQIQKIIFAIPTISASEKKKILEICKETGCEMQIVPAVYQLVNGEVKVSSIRARLKSKSFSDVKASVWILRRFQPMSKTRSYLSREEAVLLEANFAGRLRPMERNSSLSLIFMKIMPTILNRSFAENTLP